LSVSQARERLCFALDYPSWVEARAAAEELALEVGVLKVGLELFVRQGPAALNELQGLGPKLFLDLKLHDIPATVERAVAIACGLGVHYLTVHAAGGPRMLEAAQQRVVRENTGLRLLGVTVLTSMEDAELHAVGVPDSAAGQVQRLAACALGAGCDGLVCSVQELGALRSAFGSRPTLVTPGIRGSGSATQDQSRVGTATDAIHGGSSLLVVGRPIRDAAGRVEAARQLTAEIEAAQRVA
jgi:orotidine-5'-phosphate decarboxylase